MVVDALRKPARYDARPVLTWLSALCYNPAMMDTITLTHETLPDCARLRDEWRLRACPDVFDLLRHLHVCESCRRRFPPAPGGVKMPRNSAVLSHTS